MIVVGPATNNLSHDESFELDQELDDSYDHSNAINVFDNELVIASIAEGQPTNPTAPSNKQEE